MMPSNSGEGEGNLVASQGGNAAMQTTADEPPSNSVALPNDISSEMAIDNSPPFSIEAGRVGHEDLPSNNSNLPSPAADDLHTGPVDTDLYVDEGERDDAATATITPLQSYAPTGVTEGMPQEPMSINPPIPDAQMIAALDEEIGEKSTIGKPEIIEDDDDSMPLTAAAMAAAINNEDIAVKVKGKTKKGPELIEEDDDNPTHIFASLQDGENEKLRKKHATGPGQATQPQPHATANPAAPNQTVLESNQNPPNTSTQGQALVRPQVLPPPQSMLPDPSGDTQAPTAPMFHEVEATLVEDPPTVPVYQATIVVRDHDDIDDRSESSSEAEVPWWKRHQRYLIFGVILATCVILAVMGTLLASQGRGDNGTANDDSEGDALRGGAEPTTKPTVLLGSSNLTAGLVDPPSDEPPAASSAKPADTPTGEHTAQNSSSLLLGKPSVASIVPNVTSTAKLIPNDGDLGDKFGSSVSVSGETVVIGAHQDDDNGTDSGAAYVFIPDGDTWIQQAKLLPNDGQTKNYFGRAVSISGDIAIIGAPRDDDNGDKSGSAYVFIRNVDSWNQQTKLLPGDGQPDDRFGRAVAASGDSIIVGAPNHDENGKQSGAAYVFIHDGDTWSQQVKLLAPDGQANDWFGHAVSISGQTVVISSYFDDDNGQDSGSVYVFIREGLTWNQQAKIAPSGGEPFDKFGRSVSVSGDTLVVGASHDDDNGDNSGSAYVFIRDGGTWSQQAKLVPVDAHPDYYFGRAVSVSSDTIVIGASRVNSDGSNVGSAYLFKREGEIWNQVSHLLPNDGQADDYGVSVGVSGQTIVIGDDDNYDNSGSAHAFIHDEDA